MGIWVNNEGKAKMFEQLDTSGRNFLIRIDFQSTGFIIGSGKAPEISDARELTIRIFVIKYLYVRLSSHVV